MAAPGPKLDLAAAAGGDLLLHLLQPRDRRIQAAVFFLSTGGGSLLYGLINNPSVNPESLITGLGFFTLGSTLALLTLGGAGPARAAARMEGALRRLFF
ncbi:hypothetical protein PR202_ga27518 [Eleusine coracana subsp. coracana]|uniref:Uncharacterized protein n=1 Tax=Eleusine coracana subsp. coracana TaxID=191504 RepID=A0AAV5DHV9_ELECO|nr:hypothetical protein PR202_ga27518 [Eleusine coracana subsp. coracana]